MKKNQISVVMVIKQQKVGPTVTQESTQEFRSIGTLESIAVAFENFLKDNGCDIAAKLSFSLAAIGLNDKKHFTREDSINLLAVLQKKFLEHYALKNQEKEQPSHSSPSIPIKKATQTE